MKKVLMLVIVGTVLASTVPNVCAMNPTIKVQDPQPATASLWSYLVGLFTS